MKTALFFLRAACLFALAAPLVPVPAQTSSSAAPYRVITTAKVGGAGGFDYVVADSDGRKLYVPRGDRVTVFDLDTLKPAGVISPTNSVHGAAIDPASHHGFCSSRPVVMWDTQTLATIKTIDVQGGPDGILFDPATERVFVFSHRTPNATVIDAKDGSIVGTMDLGGAPEQAASDGQGHLYVDIEDKDNVAVVDAAALKVTAHYDLGGKGGGPAGLALDAKNHILFACCRNPQVVVILDANTGRIITSLPIGSGCDGALFNPHTMEEFSSQRDGTLTVVKENSPDSFEVEQTVPTQTGAKTSTLDSQTDRILLIRAEMAPPPTPSASSPSVTQNQGGGEGKGGPKRGGRGQMVPGSFSILVVGR